MTQRTLKQLFLPVIFLLSAQAFGEAGLGNLRNDFTFYADNTEFFTPFRLRQTLLGQQFKSYLDLETGDHTGLWAGLFADHPSALLNSSVNVLPILTFVYRQDGFKGVFGTLQPVNRHAFLEPLEVTTLEITRPIEYGMQLIQNSEAFKADVFVDWQTLLTSSSRETFDYGGTAAFSPFPFLELGAQAHGYHVGGVTYGGVVRNNMALGAGLTLKGVLPLLGETSLAFFDLASKDTNRPNYPGPVQGSGYYCKGTLSPIPDVNFFGIAWIGKDFMSDEGDSNYNSFGYDGVYYLSDRTYEEAGVQWKATLESGIVFDFEFRSHWIEDAWSHSLRIMAQIPFDLEVDLRKKKQAESTHE